MRPRPYLSYSQMTLFEMRPKDYIRQYVYGEQSYFNKNMKYGTMVADTLEVEDWTGDPVLDLTLMKVPAFGLRDKVIQDRQGIRVWYDVQKRYVKIPVLENGDDDVPILAKPDTAKKNYTAFKEYKTSTRKWTQRMVDESGQITFYALAIWLRNGQIPQNIELVVVHLKYDEKGVLVPTGELSRYSTKRTMADIIKMSSRIKKSWAGIYQLCSKELI